HNPHPPLVCDPVPGPQRASRKDRSRAPEGNRERGGRSASPKQCEKTSRAGRQTSRASGYPCMGASRPAAPSSTHDRLRRARGGDPQALAGLFPNYRDRLRRMVNLRLDRRLYGRLDPSDVLQEAYLDCARRFPEYARAPTLPFYLWLRALTGQKL